jgi:2-polyprenyl-3-methyl-5-hydroxy-6-metoxy-1,4-benzoquinol methylase
MAIRRFFELTKSNAHNCNLTELLASESVDRGYVTHNDWLGHVNRYAYVWKVLTKSKVKTLLDVGCGKLQLPYFLWRNRAPAENFTYWGLELRATPNWLPAEDEHWQVTLNLVKTDFLEDSYDQLEGWPGQFDLVVCFEVLEHIPRERGLEFIKRLYNWTKPGGTCLFSTPNAGVSDSVAKNHVDEHGESREWEYDAKVEVVLEAGFKLEDTFGTFCALKHLPEDAQAKIASDPVLVKAKKFLSHAAFTSLVAAAYPEHSNNSLFHLTRPANS